jgi:hypothetical protein
LPGHRVLLTELLLVHAAALRLQPSVRAVRSREGPDEAGLVPCVTCEAARPVGRAVVHRAEAGCDDVATAGHRRFDRLPYLLRVAHACPFVDVPVRAGRLDRRLVIGRVSLREPPIVRPDSQFVDVGGAARDRELEPCRQLLEPFLHGNERLARGVLAT